MSLCWLCILRLLSLPACPPCSTKLLLSSSSCLWSPGYQSFPSQSNSSWLIQAICPWRSQENSILCFCLRTLWTWLSYFYICNLSEMSFFVRVRKVKIPFFKKKILKYSAGEAICLTKHSYICISMLPLVINPLQNVTIFPGLFSYLCTNTIVYY